MGFKERLGLYRKEAIEDDTLLIKSLRRSRDLAKLITACENAKTQTEREITKLHLQIALEYRRNNDRMASNLEAKAARLEKELLVELRKEAFAVKEISEELRSEEKIDGHELNLEGIELRDAKSAWNRHMI